MTYTGFNLDSSLNLVISGKIDLQTSLSSCPIHSTAGIIPFLKLVESDGKFFI